MGEIPQGWMSWTTGDRRSHWNLDERHFPILIIKCSQLKSFGGKAKDFSPRARMRGMLGYQMPFDRWSLLAESSCDIDHSFSGMIGLLTEMELKWDTLSITTTLPRTRPPLKSLLSLMSDLLWTAEQQCGIEWRSGLSRSHHCLAFKCSKSQMAWYRLMYAPSKSQLRREDMIREEMKRRETQQAAAATTTSWLSCAIVLSQERLSKPPLLSRLCLVIISQKLQNTVA